MTHDSEQQSLVDHLLHDMRSEALSLSLEARAFFSSESFRSETYDELLTQMIRNREMLFITARLAQVMLWVLNRGPGLDGPGITGDEARKSWEADPLLLEDGDCGDGALGHEFDALRESSLSLYRRVVRIDSQATIH